jgi:hypothetical protein
MDIETLSNFLTHAQYEKAIYLFYGKLADGNGIDVAQRVLQNRDMSQIEIWHHEAPSESARRLR